MANFAFRGLEEYAMKLSKLEASSQEIAGKAIYEGAKIVADEIKAEFDNNFTENISVSAKDSFYFLDEER